MGVQRETPYWQKFINTILKKKVDAELSSEMKKIFDFAIIEQNRMIKEETEKIKKINIKREEFNNVMKMAIAELYNKKIRQQLNDLKVEIVNSDPDMTFKSNTMGTYAQEVSGNKNVINNESLNDFLKNLRNEEQEHLTELERLNRLVYQTEVENVFDYKIKKRKEKIGEEVKKKVREKVKLLDSVQPADFVTQLSRSLRF